MLKKRTKVGWMCVGDSEFHGNLKPITRPAKKRSMFMIGCYYYRVQMGSWVVPFGKGSRRGVEFPSNGPVGIIFGLTIMIENV